MALDFVVTFGVAHALVFARGDRGVLGRRAGRALASRGWSPSSSSGRSQLRAARDERALLEVAGDRLRLSNELDALLQQRLAALARLAEDPSPARQATAATLVAIEHESRATLDRHARARRPHARRRTGCARRRRRLRSPISKRCSPAAVRDAHLQVAGTPRVLPAGVELSAYRVVEHLLAAVEPTPGVDVTIRFADDGLGITVTGPASRGGKPAVERARERVQLHRGTVESVVRGGRAEAVAGCPSSPARDVLGAAVAAVLAVSLVLARRYPLGAWAVALAAVLVEPFAPLPLVVYPLVGGHAFCAARWAGLRTGLLRTVALVGALELGTALSDGNGGVPALLFTIGGWAAGRVLGERDRARHAARPAGARSRSRERRPRGAVGALRARPDRRRAARHRRPCPERHRRPGRSPGSAIAERDPAATAETLWHHRRRRARRRARPGPADRAARRRPSRRAEAPDLALVERLVKHAGATGVPPSRSGSTPPLTLPGAGRRARPTASSRRA